MEIYGTMRIFPLRCHKIVHIKPILGSEVINRLMVKVSSPISEPGNVPLALGLSLVIQDKVKFKVNKRWVFDLHLAGNPSNNNIMTFLSLVIKDKLNS